MCLKSTGYNDLNYFKKKKEEEKKKTCIKIHLRGNKTQQSQL